MTARRAAAMASAVPVAVVAAAMISAGGSDPPDAATAPASVRHARGVVVDCSRRSEANFPGAFGDSRNVVVGPLVLVGAAYTPASVIREFGGNKFPLLVKAGHRVTVRLFRRARRFAGLACGGLGDGPLPQGKEVRLRDTAHTMTFIACQPGKPSEDYRPEGPSGSYVDGEQVTFWSGFVLARTPRCVPLEVNVDDEPSPRRIRLALGRRCSSRTA